MSEMESIKLVVHGNVLSVDDELSIHPDWLIAVDEQGFICASTAASSELGQRVLSYSTESAARVERVRCDGSKRFVLPTFVDCHLHAPQYMQSGIALDKPLMTWLESYTFPCERQLANDPQAAKVVYQALARRLIKEGTGAVALYGTLGVQSNIVLAQVFQDAGVRALVGKLSMDRHSPEDYVERTDEAVELAAKFIDEMERLVSAHPPHRRLVEPIITPRFVPTCTPELLAGLGRLARARNVKVQTHAMESRDEVAAVRSMTDGGVDDVEHLRDMGLLEGALLAHCTHVTPSQLSLMRTHDARIAHCPLSNVYFSPERSLPLIEVARQQVKVGLGSDISGGYDPSILSNARWAVGVSKSRRAAAAAPPPSAECATDDDASIDWVDALRLATQGGATALGLGERCGSLLRVGMAFDAQLIDLTDADDGGFDTFDELVRREFRDTVQKWFHMGDKSHRKGVWVQGRRLL